MSSSPIIALAKIISDAAANIDKYCTDHRVQLPELGDVFNPQAEFVLLDPFILEQASYIVGAAAQISTIVRPAPLSMMSTAIQFHVPSALRVAIETNTVEILRESGPKGLHINDIAAKNKANPEKLARVLRLLATEHIFTEVSPDVFANNRLSSVVDTGKSLQELDARPSEKHVGTSGLAALTGHFTDDVFKSSSHLGDVFSDASFCNSEDPAKTAFNLAFRTELPVFAWFDALGNEARLHRFGIGMEGGSNMFPPQAVVEGTLTFSENHGFDWEALSTGLVVDVGGGIGSQSLTVAKAHPDISFVIQDRESVVDEAIKFWEAERPEAVSTGRVKFQAHDFFQPQPVQNADVYFLRMVLHDWSDSYCVQILKHLRAAAAPHSRLFIVESVMLYACQDTTAANLRLGSSAKNQPPAPLLPNYGHANAFAYMSDIQMMVMMNGRERTLQQFRDLLASAGWELQSVDLKPPFASVHQHFVALPAEPKA